MDKYKVMNTIGDGTFGSVAIANHKITGEIVAIKKMKKKYYRWDACISLREISSLIKISHPNIVGLKEVIMEKNCLYFAFEYLEKNVYEVMKDRRKLFNEI